MNNKTENKTYMCKYCDDDSNDCQIFQDGNEWYLEVRTDEWDDYNDDFVHQQVFIDYCPFCGEKLYAKQSEVNGLNEQITYIEGEMG